MATDLVPIIAIASSSAVALASIVSQLWQSRQTHRRQRQHQHETWIRDQRAACYVQFLQLVLKVKHTKDGTKAISSDEGFELFARLLAFGSEPVQNIMQLWAVAGSEDDSGTERLLDAAYSQLYRQIANELQHPWSF